MARPIKDRKSISSTTASAWIPEETQSYGGQSQTVKHQYDPRNGKRGRTRYIPTWQATENRVRNQFDTLQRTTEVDLDGTPIASYLYTGTDRVAQQSAGNGTKMRFDYDSRRRLTREEVAAVGIPAAENRCQLDRNLQPRSVEDGSGGFTANRRRRRPRSFYLTRLRQPRSYHFLHDIAREPEAKRLCDNSGERLILGSSKAAV